MSEVGKTDDVESQGANLLPEGQAAQASDQYAQNAQVQAAASGRFEQIKACWQWLKFDCGPLHCGCAQGTITVITLQCALGCSLMLSAVVLNQLFEIARDA